VTDVRVGIDKTGRNIRPRGIDDFRHVPAGVFRARSDIADPPVDRSDLHPVEELARTHINKSAAGDDEIGWDLAQRAANQSRAFLIGERHDRVFNMKP